jgi:CubicO group peptidase (beta-lactamase class C family)
MKTSLPIVPALLALVAIVNLAAARGAEPGAKGSADSKILAAIPQRMAEFVERKQFAGAVTLVAHRGKVVSLEAVGLADIDARRPMTKDTLFWIASMTKPITGTAVMILRDEGKLAIDDPVEKFLPEFKDIRLGDGKPARSVTIRDLLTHTSGVANPPADASLRDASLGEITKAIAAQPLQFEPGSQWRYGSGLTVAGRIVEAVSGLPFEDFLARRIFEPLGMKDTTFYPSSEQRARLATIYKPGKEPGTFEATTAGFINADEKGPRRAPNPSGGLCSSADDLFRFYQMVLNGGTFEGKRIVSPDSVKAMTSNHTGELKAGFVPGSCWGLGWGIVREPTGVTANLSPGTYGHGGAFGTQGWVDPQEELICVLLIQRTGFGNADGSDPRAELQRLAAEALKK